MVIITRHGKPVGLMMPDEAPPVKRE